MLKKLRDLEGQVIELRISIARYLKNSFFGEISGRVRVIHGPLSADSTTWVGNFAFDYDADVFYDADDDKYSLHVAENDEK
jgi:hypothetical protein